MPSSFCHAKEFSYALLLKRLHPVLGEISTSYSGIALFIHVSYRNKSFGLASRRWNFNFGNLERKFLTKRWWACGHVFFFLHCWLCLNYLCPYVDNSVFCRRLDIETVKFPDVYISNWNKSDGRYSIYITFDGIERPQQKIVGGSKLIHILTVQLRRY